MKTETILQRTHTGLFAGRFGNIAARRGILGVTGATVVVGRAVGVLVVVATIALDKNLRQNMQKGQQEAMTHLFE